MVLERLSKEDSRLYEKAMELYKIAFPEIERRSDSEQMRVMDNAHYCFDVICDDGEFVGIMLYWEIGDLIFLEHFATLPGLRNRGYGSKALELLKQKGRSIILEIEDPADELTCRRYEFYRRNGFLMNEYYHLQAKYRFTADELMLKILSYPCAITREKYLRFIDFMNREIGVQSIFSKDVIVRPMRYTDDRKTVAKLIYSSNLSVNRYWFSFSDNGVKVIEKMMELPTIYNRDNILVATIASGEIVGVLVGTNGIVQENEAVLDEAFELAGVPCDQKTHYVFENYYSKMQNSNGEYYVVSLAVDPAFRRCGIGTTLLMEAIKNKKRVHLECDCENITAWRIFQRMGFCITDEYRGIFDTPYYKMSFYDTKKKI